MQRIRFSAGRERAGLRRSTLVIHPSIMNSPVVSLEHPSRPLHTAPVLAQHGFSCVIHTLEPDADALLPASTSGEEQLLFVVDGDIAVHHDGVVMLLDRGAACLVKPGSRVALTARAGTPSRVLCVEIPPREVVTAQIITPRT